jgi:hypothetical protein
VTGWLVAASAAVSAAAAMWGVWVIAVLRGPIRCQDPVVTNPGDPVPSGTRS